MHARRRALREAGDRGAAVAEFAMISVLLVGLLFVVLQVALAFYVRNVVAAAAADGARWAGNADVDAADGGPRATEQIRRGLGGGVAEDVPCTSAETVDPASGLPIVEVTCRGRIRSVFVPYGPFVEIRTRAAALKESS